MVTFPTELIRKPTKQRAKVIIKEGGRWVLDSPFSKGAMYVMRTSINLFVHLVEKSISG